MLGGFGNNSDNFNRFKGHISHNLLKDTKNSEEDSPELGYPDPFYKKYGSKFSKSVRVEGFKSNKLN